MTNMKKPSLTFQIFIALILSVTVGLLMQHCSGVAVKHIHPSGVILLNLSILWVFWTIVPIGVTSLFCPVVASIVRIIDMDRTRMSVTGDAACSVMM